MSWKHQNIYKQAGKYEDQQKFKDILEAAMVSSPEGFTDDIPISPMISTLLKKSRAKKSLYLFTYILDLKHISTRWVGATKSKRKAIKYVTTS